MLKETYQLSICGAWWSFVPFNFDGTNSAIARPHNSGMLHIAWGRSVSLNGGVRADRNERRDVQLRKTKRICTWEIGRNPTKESILAELAASNPPILSGTMLIFREGMM